MTLGELHFTCRHELWHCFAVGLMMVPILMMEPMMDTDDADLNLKVLLRYRNYFPQIRRNSDGGLIEGLSYLVERWDSFLLFFRACGLYSRAKNSLDKPYLRAHALIN